MKISISKEAFKQIPAYFTINIRLFERSNFLFLNEHALVF